MTAITVYCPECKVQRQPGCFWPDPRTGDHYLLVPCKHTVLKSEATGLKIEEVL